MLKNALTLAIVAVHTAENEPLRFSLFHFIISFLLRDYEESEKRNEKKSAGERRAAGKSLLVPTHGAGEGPRTAPRRGKLSGPAFGLG